MQRFCQFAVPSVAQSQPTVVHTRARRTARCTKVRMSAYIFNEVSSLDKRRSTSGNCGSIYSKRETHALSFAAAEPHICRDTRYNTRPREREEVGNALSASRKAVSPECVTPLARSLACSSHAGHGCRNSHNRTPYVAVVIRHLGQESAKR